jgi:very-short-patch-repair endonuclease
MDFVNHSRLHLGSKDKNFINAKELRSNTTEAEDYLWKFLANRRLNGYKFRRQHPILKYIADFYCHEARLIVEVDGDVHNNEDCRMHDEGRSDELKEYGVRVIRFTNHEILNSIEKVLQQINITIEQSIDENKYL